MTSFLQNLTYMVFKDKIWILLMSYLKDRKQCTKIGNNFSEFKYMCCGIHEGLYWNHYYLYSILMICQMQLRICITTYSNKI